MAKKKQLPDPVETSSREPIEGTWGGMVTWACPIDGFTVIEEPGVDAKARVIQYTDSMYPVIENLLLPGDADITDETPPDGGDDTPPADDAGEEGTN